MVGSQLLTALMAGGMGGGLALALDVVLARALMGYGMSVSSRLGLASVALGLVLGTLVHFARRAFRRGSASWVNQVLFTLALIYGGSVFERVEKIGIDRLAPPLAFLAGFAALLAYGLWVAGLRRLVGEERSTSVALALGAGTVALGLALNRHLLHRPAEPLALAVDGGLVVTALVLAWSWRVRSRSWWPAILAGCLGFAVVGVVFFIRSGVAISPAISSTVSKSPHVVLLTLDTLRKDIFDRVIEETEEGRAFRRALGPAAWFDNAIAASPWTAPSVASILTGLYPSEHGYGLTPDSEETARMTRLDRSIRTLAESLREQDYGTSAIVTNPYLHRSGGLARGFLEYEFLQGATVQLALARLLARLRMIPRDVYPPADLVRRRFERQVDRVSGRGPVFLWAHFMDPHAPLLEHADLPAEDSGLSQPGQRGQMVDEGLYRQETRFLCRELTELFEILKRRDMWSNTLLILVADHGEMFFSDGHRGRLRQRVIHEGHGHALHDELLRVPLIVRPPGGLPAERRIEALASQVDLRATIMDLLGLESAVREGYSISWAPWLRVGSPAPATPPRTHVLLGGLQSGPPSHGIQTADWKLIHSPSGFEPDALYDLVADPTEQRNLAEENMPRREELKALMKTIRQGRKPLFQAGEETPVELSLEDRRRLKALGYIQ